MKIISLYILLLFVCLAVLTGCASPRMRHTPMDECQKTNESLTLQVYLLESQVKDLEAKVKIYQAAARAHWSLQRRARLAEGKTK